MKQCLMNSFSNTFLLCNAYPYPIFPDLWLPAYLGSVVLLLLERVSEAQRLAQRELREQDPRKSGRRSIENDNEENADHIVKSFQRVNRGRGGGKRKGGRGGGKRKGGRGGGGPRKRT